MPQVEDATEAAKRMLFMPPGAPTPPRPRQGNASHRIIAIGLLDAEYSIHGSKHKPAKAERADKLPQSPDTCQTDGTQGQVRGIPAHHDRWNTPSAVKR